MLSRAGDAPGALSMARRAVESTEKIGSVVGRVGAYGSVGTACVVGREWQSARESLEIALELGRANQAARFLDAYVAALAEAHRLFTEMGATGHAERLAEEIGC